jgi:cell division cycle protein 37
MSFKLTPWNVDTLSKEKWTKTIINKDEPKKSDENMTEQERAERYVGGFGFKVL